LNLPLPHEETSGFSYAVYGLGVHSVLELPELLRATAKPDVVIEFGPLAQRPESSPEVPQAQIATEGVYLTYPRVGTFLIQAGKRIAISPHPGVEERVLRLFLLGSCLGVALHQRERLVLHASAVAVGDRTVGFLSHSGGGKSTLAAAMHRRDHRLVADDVVALDASAVGQTMVYPGFPQLKLWPEAVEALGEALETLPHIRPGIEKRARRITHGFARGPLPLKRLYVLAEAKANRVELLPPQEAIVELIRHSYCARLLQSIGREAHFRQCATVVNQIGVRRLNVNRSLAKLPELAQLVEDDLANNL
jgi:hypothetical protein